MAFIQPHMAQIIGPHINGGTGIQVIGHPSSIDVRLEDAIIKSTLYTACKIMGEELEQKGVPREEIEAWNAMLCSPDDKDKHLAISMIKPYDNPGSIMLEFIFVRENYHSALEMARAKLSKLCLKL